MYIVQTPNNHCRQAYVKHDMALEFSLSCITIYGRLTEYPQRAFWCECSELARSFTHSLIHHRTWGFRQFIT